MNAVDIITRKWKIDSDSTVPPFEQTRLRILDLAGSGALAVGTKLPSVRSLATVLGVAANTVARAYRELEHVGVVATAGRSGTVIAVGGDVIQAQVAEAADVFADVVREVGMSAAKAKAIIAAALDR